MKHAWKVLLLLLALALLGARGITGSTELPFGLGISMRMFSGFSHVHKFGFSTDIDNVEKTVYQGQDFGGGVRVFTNMGSTPFTLMVSSDNASDAELDLRVQGIDADYDEVDVEVTLGPGGIEFVQVGKTLDWRRVNRAFLYHMTPLTGTVYFHKDTTDGDADGVPDTPLTDIITVIDGSENQTLQSAYSVPDGYAGYLHQWCVSNLGTGGDNPTSFRLRATDFGLGDRVQSLHSVADDDHFCEFIDPPLWFAARADIELTAISTGAAANQDVSGTFTMILAPE